MENEVNKIVKQGVKQDVKQAMQDVERIAGGRDKHSSLNEAALYSNLMSDNATLEFLAGKVEERSALIRELMKMNVESGFTLLPTIPRDELGAFMAIEHLAKHNTVHNTGQNTGAHEILGKIAEIDKARFMAGDPASQAQ